VESGYKKLAIAQSINAVIMFFVMYVMIDQLSHFHFNINKVYMTLLMVLPMLVVMLLVMRSMFMNRQRNIALITGAVVLFILIFFFVRTQTPVGDAAFLRSMIPHHSSAILMCQEANLTDPEISALCDEIIQAQREEIAQMEAILARMQE
jgi:membrane-associated HD superfamily phosphohydrolase